MYLKKLNFSFVLWPRKIQEWVFSFPHRTKLKENSKNITDNEQEKQRGRLVGNHTHFFLVINES